MKMQVATLTPPQLAIIAWSFARLARHDHQTDRNVQEVVEAASQVAVTKIEMCSARDMANILWACARLACNNIELQEAIGHQVFSRADEFGS